MWSNNKKQGLNHAGGFVTALGVTIKGWGVGGSLSCSFFVTTVSQLPLHICLVKDFKPAALTDATLPIYRALEHSLEVFFKQVSF